MCNSVVVESLKSLSDIILKPFIWAVHNPCFQKFHSIMLNKLSKFSDGLNLAILFRMTLVH